MIREFRSTACDTQAFVCVCVCVFVCVCMLLRFLVVQFLMFFKILFLEN